MDRGARIDANRFARWEAVFAGYRNPVTRGMIELWIEQFANRDSDLAARTLDAITFVTNQHISTVFRDLLQSLEGWDKQEDQRRGRWFFVPFSGSAGESGDTMTHAFRIATGMTRNKYNKLSVHRSDLVNSSPGPDDTVVLLDDFSGTGTQACNAWKEIFEELLTEGPRVVLMLITATQHALRRINRETELEAVCGSTLTAGDNIFDPACRHFTDEEKATLLRYCRGANAQHPQGWGESGLVIVFAHRCPNNSIPILHANHQAWRGLFPRD